MFSPSKTKKEASGEAGSRVSPTTTAFSFLEPSSSTSNTAKKTKEKDYEENFGSLADVEKALRKRFGYHFNKDGQLRDENDEKFKFTSQEDYEELGHLLTQYVYHKLIEAGLKREYLEEKETGKQTGPSIFFSPDLFQSNSPLLVLIHGTGVVRAGQWARKLIINDSLNDGTMLPFIYEAQSRRWQLLLMNTNERGHKRSLDEFDHGDFVWDNYVVKSPAKKIFVVAHSMGGSVMYHIANRRSNGIGSKLDQRLRMVLLTDSWWFAQGCNESSLARELPYIIVNFVARKTPLKRDCSGVIIVPAGTCIHEWSSPKSKDTIFRLLDEEMAKGPLTAEHVHDFLRQFIPAEEEEEKKEERKVEDHIEGNYAAESSDSV